MRWHEATRSCIHWLQKFSQSQKCYWYGVAPNVALVFASKLYPGNISDVAIVEHRGLLHQLSPGDMILASKGFWKHKLLPQDVHINILPFLTAKSQYTPAEVQFWRKLQYLEYMLNVLLKELKIMKYLDTFHTSSDIYSSNSSCYAVS